MINKKNIWFLTLFSLILVLSVYYITMPSELLLTNLNEEKKPKAKEVVEIKESDIIETMKIENEEKRLEELDSLKLVLMDTKKSVDEKNEAFEKMKNLNVKKSEEEKLEKNIKDNFKLDAFVKIDNDNIKVTVSSKKNDKKLANDIMRNIQSNYETKKYITVEFK